MRRTETMPLAKLLLQAISENNKLTEGLDTVKIIKLWHEVVGVNISKSTSDIQFIDGKLTVKINSPLFRNEIKIIKNFIIKEINSKIGKNYVKDIIIR